MFNIKIKKSSKNNRRRGYNFYKNNSKPKSNYPILKKNNSKVRQSTKNTKRNFFSGFIKVIFIIIFSYIGYYFFYSDNFIINQIYIKGLQDISMTSVNNIIKEQTDKSRFFIFKQSNLLIFNKDVAINNIKEKYVVKKIEITKKFPHTLDIKIEEKISSAIWVNKEADKNKYYYMDLNGVILGEIPYEKIIKIFPEEKKIQEGEEVIITTNKSGENNNTNTSINKQITPTIHNLNNDSVNINEQVIDGKVIKFITELKNKFAENFINIPIKYFATPKKGSSRINLVTEEGWEILFETENNLDDQLDNLRLVTQKKIQNLSNIEYIDLRFSERIYYK